MHAPDDIATSVRLLDHTGDIAVEIVAPTLVDLFDGAAVGVMAILEGRDDVTGVEGRPEVNESHAWNWIELDAPDLPALLVAWLREVVYMRQDLEVHYSGVDSADVREQHLRARVQVLNSPRPMVREIKGITYHNLEVTHTPDGWRTRIVVDV